jgi:hypothetical protein
VVVVLWNLLYQFPRILITQSQSAAVVQHHLSIVVETEAIQYFPRLHLLAAAVEPVLTIK